jgi:hypothetical protein
MSASEGALCFDRDLVDVVDPALDLMVIGESRAASIRL